MLMNHLFNTLETRIMENKLNELAKAYADQVEDCATLRSKITNKQAECGRKGHIFLCAHN